MDVTEHNAPNSLSNVNKVLYNTFDTLNWAVLVNLELNTLTEERTLKGILILLS